LSAAPNVKVMQKEHGCPSGSIREPSRVGVLGDEASGCFILPVEDEGDDGCTGRDVSKL
jgi:hypothetical protein